MTEQRLLQEIRIALNLASLSIGIGKKMDVEDRFVKLCQAYAAAQVATPNPFYPKRLAKLQKIEAGEMTLVEYIREVEEKVKGATNE
jgi:hypothetical protein